MAGSKVVLWKAPEKDQPSEVSVRSGLRETKRVDPRVPWVSSDRLGQRSTAV